MALPLIWVVPLQMPQWRLAIGDAITNEEQLKIQKSQLELDNRRLNAQIEASTLRPQVSGIYGSNAQGSSEGGSGVSGGGGDADGLGGHSGIDLRREVKVAPVESTPGAHIVDNSITGGPVVLPGNHGEVTGIDELATAIVLGGPQVALNHATKSAGNRRQRLNDAAEFAAQEDWYVDLLRDLKRGVTPPSPQPSFYGSDPVRQGFSYAQ